MDNNHLMNESATEFSTLLDLAGFRYWTASLLPALVGTTLPFWLRPPGFSFRLFAAIEFLVATILVHAGFSFLLAYFEGNQEAEWQKPRLLKYAGICFVTAGLLGLHLNSGLILQYGVSKSIFVIYGLVTLIVGALYVVPPINLGRRIGREIVIAEGLGMIPVLGAYLVQVGDITRKVYLASMPLVFSIGLWIWLEELASKQEDEKNGRRTLVIEFGPKFSRRYGTAALSILLIAALIAAVVSTSLPPLTLSALFVVVLMRRIMVVSWHEHTNPEQIRKMGRNAFTMHLIAGLVVAVSPLTVGFSATQQVTNIPALGDTQTRPKDGAIMVYVPAGQFEMGSRQERPIHTVALDTFWIDQTEVTNAMFTAFLNERGNQIEEDVSWWEPGAGHRGIIYGYIDEDDDMFYPRTGYEEFPVIEVSWYGAAAYCAWVGGRLPTEAEWEYAARGTQGWEYPWGNTFDGLRVNYCDVNCTYAWKDTNFDDGFSRWGPVGSYPDGASWCGALDMAGNVWEWVGDWWSGVYYARSPTENPQGPEFGALRVARGGSWFDEDWKVSTSLRKALTPSSYRMHWVGFRCVVTARPSGEIDYQP